MEQHVGLHLTALTYNTFALPVLTYVAQLTNPPSVTLEAEQQMLHQATPGPFSWVDDSDLWWLKQLTGLPQSFVSLRFTAQAAQLRVRMWDQACSDQPPDPLTPLVLGCNHYTAVGSQLSQPPIQRSQGRRNNVRATSLFSQRADHLRALISAPTCTYARAY